MNDLQKLDPSFLLKCIKSLFKVPWEILDYLKTNKHRKRPLESKDIQRVFHIGSSTASSYLTTLENLGLIKRERHGKYKYIRISSLGESFVL